MGTAILIVLILLVLYIAFRYFKVGVSNSALRNEDNTYLPPDSANEDGEAAEEPADAGDTDDAGDPSDTEGDNAEGKA